MPAHLRFQSQTWATHHVVSRCIQGFALLKPTREIRAITKGVLAYSLELYQNKIELHHYVVLSNHFGSVLIHSKACFALMYHLWPKGTVKDVPIRFCVAIRPQ